MLGTIFLQHASRKIYVLVGSPEDSRALSEVISVSRLRDGIRCSGPEHSSEAGSLLHLDGDGMEPGNSVVLRDWSYRPS